MEFKESIDKYNGSNAYILSIEACRGAIYFRGANTEYIGNYELDQVLKSCVGSAVGKRKLFVITKNKSKISEYKKVLIEKIYQMLIDEISIGEYSEIVGIRLREAVTCSCFKSILRRKKLDKLRDE